MNKSINKPNLKHYKILDNYTIKKLKKIYYIKKTIYYIAFRILIHHTT